MGSRMCVLGGNMWDRPTGEIIYAELPLAGPAAAAETGSSASGTVIENQPEVPFPE
jgi:hypothetical protein